MPRTGITGDQVRDESLEGKDILDGSVTKQDLNITSTGKAVVTRILPGTDISIDSTGIDEGTGEVTINFNSSTGGITASQHRSLDQLVHELAEDSYAEIERTGGRVSGVTFYSDSGKTTKIREIEYNRTAGRISQIIVTQYDSGGNPITGEILTGNITRVGGRVSSIEWVLT